ncbi:hypothetical protein BASA61_009225 [Batrachochytrium salamandrivorans]|nr:hypothetical protein BASA61_009225 [Batrachochytrium salamandrivorans]
MQSWRIVSNIPLVKIPVPIKLRLADGDSSSMITHRTLPLQLHIGRHVETIGFYVTSLCHGIILGYSWLERHNPKSIGSPGWWILDPVIVWRNCCVGSTRIQGLGKPPRTSDISPKPSIPEQESSDQTSDSAAIPDIDQVYSKIPVWISIWESKTSTSKFSNTSKSVSFAETFKPKFIRSWKHLRFLRLLFLRRSMRNFSSVFSESQADILPSHRSFDCTINLSSSAEPSYGRIYQLTREEDKVMQEWIAENLAKGFIRNSSSPYGAPLLFSLSKRTNFAFAWIIEDSTNRLLRIEIPIPLISEMLRPFLLERFYYFGSPWRLQLLRIKEGDEPKTALLRNTDSSNFL